MFNTQYSEYIYIHDSEPQGTIQHKIKCIYLYRIHRKIHYKSMCFRYVIFTVLIAHLLKLKRTF